MGISKCRKGMTLIEAVVASSLFSLAAIVALSTIVDMIRMIDAQKTVLAIDEQGNRVLNVVSDAVRMAVLPVRVSYGSNEGYRSNSRNIFADVDGVEYGFGGIQGSEWRNELQTGMDSIAFVVPIDAQGVGDVLDDNTNLQIGYERSGRSYMSATPSGTPGAGTGFSIRSSTELVNVLAAMDPVVLDSDGFAKIQNPTPTDVKSAFTLPAGQNITTFMAVRFVPVLDGSNNPVLISEAKILNDKIDVDLDGDGAYDGVFQVGRLQLYFSGGRLPYVEVVGSGNSATRTLRWEDVDAMAVDLTPDTVLRRNDPNDRVPIFRLVSFDRDNLSDSSDYVGMIEEGNADDNAVKALAIRVLLLDNNGIHNGALQSSSPNLIAMDARWFSTTVYLKNMDRN